MTNASVFHGEQVLSKEESDRYYNQVKSVTEWKRNTVTIFGRVCKENRLSQSYSLTGSILRYKYSGQMHTAVPAPPVIAELLERCTEWILTNNLEQSEFPANAGKLIRERKWFNFVLANWYQSGLDTIGLHADDEKALIGPILSLSLGETRHFDFIAKEKGQRKIRINLSGGSIVLMAGETQRNWKHTVPKETRVLNGRINLTFRRVQD